jgi:hypothetical protein
MFYSLLGRIVWKALLSFLRLKYGPTMLPKPVLAAATVAVGVAGGVALQRATRSEDA